MADERQTSAGNEEPISFEEALARLEQSVQQLEEGCLGLHESLLCYERGIGYLKQCYQALEQVEQRIELLAAIQTDGSAVTKPFYDGELDESSMSLEEKKRLRSRRRSHPSGSPSADGSPPSDIDTPGGLF